MKMRERSDKGVEITEVDKIKQSKMEMMKMEKENYG